jgi:hypothetical protein
MVDKCQMKKLSYPFHIIIIPYHLEVNFYQFSTILLF